MGLEVTKITKLFKYRKANKSYWNKSNFYKQIVNKILLIAEVLYLGYSYLFLFDNATNHTIYINNALYTS